MGRLGLILGVLIFLTHLAQAETLSELRARAPKASTAIPEPNPGQGCPVPPVPTDSPSLEGEGWSLNHLIAWRNFDLHGMRYYIEYQVLRRSEKGGVVTRPFPSLYMLDLNRDGVFDIPGEAWMDMKGDGRCADLELVPAPAEGESKKPLA